MRPRALYVHIPFCRVICRYCDFPKVLYAQNWAFSYVDALLDELSSLEGPYETIYVGGGTPTALPAALLEKVLFALREKLLPGGEFSIEANPDSLTNEILGVLIHSGVNRLSIGIQTSSEKWLKYLGRTHSFAAAKEAVERAKDWGLSNINVDLMYGFPGQTDEEFAKDIKSFLALDVPHISAYSLQIEEGTALYNEKAAVDDDRCASFYETMLKAFRQAGYDRYEVSNFAKPGHKCRHNLTYWHDEEYDAAGLGAAGYRDGLRFRNTRNLSAYLKGERRSEEEPVSKEDDIKYYFMTNLRLEEGFALSDFEKRFGFRFEERYAAAIQAATKEGLLSMRDGRAAPTDRGILLLDRLLLLLY